MINLFLMALFAVLFFIFFAFLKPSKSHNIIALICVLLFIGSVVFGIINEAYHYGMSKTTTEKTQKIYSAVPKQDVLLYQPLNKKGTETIYMYRKDENDKKPKTTQADSIVTNRVVYQGKEARLVTKTTTWTYNNSVIRFFFHYPEKETEVAKIENVFYVPKSWKVLTPQQEKAMMKTLVQKQAKAKMMEKMKDAHPKK